MRCGSGDADTLTLDEIVFRARALAQTHPFTRRAQSFVNATVANEIKIRPARAMADWASHALTVGYCLRKLEEEENGNPPIGDTGQSSPQDVEALDQHSSDLVERLRTETGNDFLLYPEDLVVDALDRIIYGEIDRRLSHYAEKLDPESFEELESYIGWWTLKGYCLRVAEQLVGAEGETPHIDS